MVRIGSPGTTVWPRRQRMLLTWPVTGLRRTVAWRRVLDLAQALVFDLDRLA